jgi:hypothetical protein
MPGTDSAMNFVRFIIFLCANALAFALTGCQALRPTPPGVVDLTDKLHLTRVGDVITDGRTLFVCVENTKHVTYLMNVVTYKLERSLPFATEGCGTRLPSDLQRLKMSIQYRPVSGISNADIASALDAARIKAEQANGPLPTNSSFFGGKIYLRTVAVTQNCGPNLPYYYTVMYPSGDSYSFYLIVRLKRPVVPPISRFCQIVGEGEDVEPGRERIYQFYFEDEGFMRSIDTGNGTTLLIDESSNAVEPVLLAVRSLPSAVWSSHDNVFIVPRDRLLPLLDKAGSDSTKRIQALTSLIGQAGGYSVVDQ